MTAIPLYYIRFLKPPPTEYLIGQQFTIVWTVESDLGDCTYWEPISIVCSLQGSSQLGLRVLNTKRKRSGSALGDSPLSRDIMLTYDPLQGGGTVNKLVIEPLPGKSLPLGHSVSIQFGMFLSPSSRTSQAHDVWQNAYLFSDSLWLIPTWSSPIQAKAAKQRHGEAVSGHQAERIVKVDDNKVIRICEDAVQSIARHIWDCGLSMCQFIKENKDELKNYDTLLELGSGTGLVGIYADQVLQPKQTYLTDLADALEIMQQNVDLMENNNSVFVKELSWGSERREEYKHVDLILHLGLVIRE
ncbi:hypothetical protein G6F61_006155 [Rhizopus arrhizus]|nr:hypothetical protein G6F42_007850 [Rhizopus arrhizus]KAG1378080.1 hypothetical protein G6F61_006155 [Rhizopus arrhizus]